MLWFGGYLLGFDLASDWLRKNKHSRNFLWCSGFTGKTVIFSLKSEKWNSFCVFVVNGSQISLKFNSIRDFILVRDNDNALFLMIQ